MGQAKLRRAAAKSGAPWPADRPVPKDLIARAVREAVLRSDVVNSSGYAGTCLYQAEVGSRILRLRHGMDCALQVGDFLRPMTEELRHTYTNSDGQVDPEKGRFHAWLWCCNTDEIIDFAAWEAPKRIQQTGQLWTEAKPDYLWIPVSALRLHRLTPRADRDATLHVLQGLQDEPHRSLVNSCTADALAVIEAADGSGAGVEFIAENGGGAGVRLRKASADGA